MKSQEQLPIEVTIDQARNPYVMSGLASQAFRLANYDMPPENSVAAALDGGLIIVKRPTQPRKIRRMPGNGSFA